MFNYIKFVFPLVCVLSFVDGALEVTSATETTASTVIVTPIDFIVDDVTPLLGMDQDKIAAQKDFANAMGYVQYKIGNDPDVLEAVTSKIALAYGPGTMRPDGRFMWSLDNPIAGSKWEEHITVTIRKNDSGCYFIKADARRATPVQKVVMPTPKKADPSEYIAVKAMSSGTAPSFIRGVAKTIKNSDVVQIIRQKDKVLTILDPIQMDKGGQKIKARPNARQTRPES